MKSEFITLIWLGTFDSRKQLTHYTNWKYLETQDDPKCDFADDIGLNYFDSDFMECVFAGEPSELLKLLDGISYVENFKTELLTKISGLNHLTHNSIISLSGKRDIYGAINESLFDFRPISSEKSFLQFVGVFEYEDT